MARNRTSHERTLDKQRAIGRVTQDVKELCEGDIVQVTHYFADGEAVEYLASIHFDASGRSSLEPIKGSDFKAKAKMVFHSTFPIQGYLDWFLISHIPVWLAAFVHVRSCMAGMRTACRAES